MWTIGVPQPRRLPDITQPTPKRLTTADFDPDVLALFDQYVHGLMDRRAFLGGVGRSVGSAGAVAVLAALAPQFAAAQQVKPDDERIRASYENFDSPKGYGKGRGYLARAPRPRFRCRWYWWRTRTAA